MHPLNTIWIDHTRRHERAAAERILAGAAMTAFIVRRLLALVVTLWVVFTVSFLLMRAVPGGPYSSDRNLPPEIEENVKHRYRLDLPLYEQYLIELKNVVSGDLGLSQRLYDFTVNEVIAQGLPISAALGILALAFALVLGLAAGIVSAAYRGSAADLVLMSLATVGIALPSFVVAGLAIMLFVFMIPIFPAAGWGTFQQLVLPAICLGCALRGRDRPHHADEHARRAVAGLHSHRPGQRARASRRVLLRHALPGALLPVVSFLGPATAGILTGSLVIEKIFAIPGLGWHFVQAALQRDYTLTMGLRAALHVPAVHAEFPGGSVVSHSRPARGAELSYVEAEMRAEARRPRAGGGRSGRVARPRCLAATAPRSGGDALARQCW